MSRKFRDIVITNFLIVFALIPMIVCLNSFQQLISNPIFWGIVGIVLLFGLSYLQLRDEKKNDRKKNR